MHSLTQNVSLLRAPTFLHQSIGHHPKLHWSCTSFIPVQLLDGRTIRCNMAKYNPGSGPIMAPRGGYTDGYSGPRGGGGGPPDFGPGRGGGYGNGGRGFGGRGYDDGYHAGGRGRGGGRWASASAFCPFTPLQTLCNLHSCTCACCLAGVDTNRTVAELQPCLRFDRCRGCCNTETLALPHLHTAATWIY